MLLHRVWGNAKARGYSREEENELAALQSILTRKRDEDRGLLDALRLIASKVETRTAR